MIDYNKTKEYTILTNGKNDVFTLTKTESYSYLKITYGERTLIKRENIKEKNYSPTLITTLRALILIFVFNLTHKDTGEQINLYETKKIRLYRNSGLFSLFLKLYFLILIIRSI